ncbi:MAG TPA: ribonuclease III [Verrucomicrobiota bacterium]|nr:ribonuclease III [Verrucomicrobiota bacterium]HNT14399.1 ribonuclease III [Verrucomicrobiota bacterium]
MPTLADLQARLGYRFRDARLLRIALTHPSTAHEKGAPTEHNQRLEFLGDAVIQLILTRELYERFPADEEGPLTKARARLVNRRSLAQLGRALELGAQLILSHGEATHGGRERTSALADAFEALVGALFLDGGYETVRTFVLREFAGLLQDLTLPLSLDNPKGELQELLQAGSPDAPHYSVISVSGPDHDRVFECVVQHGGRELARGIGKNKKAAESDAAQKALLKLRAAQDAQGAALTPE